MNARTDFPKVNLPNLSPEEAAEVAAVREALDEADALSKHITAQQVGMTETMLKRRMPMYLGTVKKVRKPTKHQRLKARLAARSSKRAA